MAGKSRGDVRLGRLTKIVYRDVAEMIAHGLRDPRLRFGCVTEVKLTRDLKHARVMVSCLGTEGDRRTFLKGLESARGRIQSLIAKHLHTRQTPRLSFRYDEGLERSVRLSRLIDDACAEDLEAQRARGELPDEPDDSPEPSEGAEPAPSTEPAPSAEPAPEPPAP